MRSDITRSVDRSAAYVPQRPAVLLADAKAAGTPIDGVDGLLNQMTTAVLERALQTEMAHHLGCDRDEPASVGTGNSRNGASAKMVSTVNGPVRLTVPRDRLVDEVYPIVYIDGIRIKVRNKGAVTIKSVHLVIGRRRRRPQARPGRRDLLIACCDGLTGLSDAITSVFPDTGVQTCVVHVIRNAVRFVSYQDRKKITKSMRTIYTAPTVEAAENPSTSNSESKRVGEYETEFTLEKQRSTHSPSSSPDE